MPTVLLTTSGLGSRLGDITKYTNKSLVRVGRKPAISYIIESYPKDTRFVITLGHFGEQVREYLGIAHPESNFTFVEVDKYEGEGSSLGYSILCAGSKLQTPFIFHACDTIMTDPVPFGEENCLVGAKPIDCNKYRSFDVQGNKVVRLKDKGEINRDYDYAGLCYIKDYASFFLFLERAYLATKSSSLGDCDAIISMLGAGLNFTFIASKGWLDIGNSESLKHAREHICDKFEILDKVDESIYFVGKKVIKFFYDEKMCKNRIARTQGLSGLTPKILDTGKNFYSYEFAHGDTLSHVVDEQNFAQLLDWSKENLWNVNYGTDPSLLNDFYFKKTRDRIAKFVASGYEDNPVHINGQLVPSASELLDMVDADRICKSELNKFHGDFILDNIIYDTVLGHFTLIDWRQDFAGKIDVGDAYYDLAKLSHSLVINHDLVNRGLFEIEISGDQVYCDILTHHSFGIYRKVLSDFIKNNGFDEYKVRILTAIIWINMAPLHTYPLNKFLFYFGRYNLYRELKNVS